MKKANKVLSLVLAILLCVGMLPISTLTAFATDTNSGELTVGSKFYYYGLWYECEEVLNAGRISYFIKVTSPQDDTVYSGDYNIPSAFPYNGAHCIVTGIAADAFANSNVTGVHMEQTWRYYTIEHDAFLNCSSLTDVTFGKSFTADETEASINDNAFSGCTALEHIVIPPSIENIGMFVFKNCTNLKTVVYDYPYISSRRVSDYAYNDANPTVITRYLTPENPRWDGTTATWDALDTSYVQYEVQFSGIAVGGMQWLTESFYTTGTTMELSEYSTAPGYYSFTVTAIEPDIKFNNLTVDESAAAKSRSLTVGGIDISNVEAVRTGPGTVDLTFDSTSDGSLYYLATELESINGPNTNGSGIACTKGSNKITLTNIADEPLYLEIRLKNSNGMQSELVRLALPEFSMPSVQVGQVILYDGEYTTNGETKTADTPTGTGYAYYTGGVLKLNNFEYEGAGAVDSTDINAKEGIIYTTNDLKIEVIGENTFNLDREHDLLAAIFVKADLEIYGGGVLNIESDSIYEETSGIRGEGAITHTIKDITLNISLNQNESQGIHNQITGNKVIIDNAVINIDTMGRCFQVGHIQATNSIMSLTSATSNCLRGFRGLDLNNCYVNAKGEAVISVNSDTNYAINIGSGHYIFDGSNETYGAIYRGVTNLNLPSSYNYRTDKTAEFINSTTPFAHDNDEKYIEIYTDDWNIPVEAEWSADSLTYNGTEQAITATIKNKADVNDDVELVLTGNKGTNANIYTATVTGLTGKDAVKYTLVGGQNLTKNWEITKANQSAPTTPVGVNTTYIDTTDGKITGVDSTMEYRKEGDANYTAVTGTEITNLAAGTYYVRYAANGNYNASPDEQIIISLGGKRTPTIDTDPTASRVIIGGKLSDSTLTGGVASVDGEFAWVNPDAVMNTAGKIDMLVRFTPTDTTTYNTFDFEIEVEVVVCDTANGEHDYTDQKTNADEHWTVCAKCGVEKTDSREAHKGGTATCTAKAKCEICDTEYGELLDHKYEWVIDKEPTAAEQGSKHEECTVCKAKQNENTAIPKTETNSPQTGDNSNMHFWIALLFISGMGLVGTTIYGRKKKEIK